MNIEQLIVDAKIVLIREFPFMSYMVMSANYIENNDIETMAATMCVGKPVIYYNNNFTKNILQNENERAYVLAHEILHIFLSHIGRQKIQSYNHSLWNVATDYCINNNLNDLKSNKVFKPSKIQLLDDVKYKDMSSDEIYEKILKENDNDINKALATHGQPLDEVGYEDLTEEEKAKIQATLVASVNKYFEFGNDSSSLFRMFKNILEPKINWKSVLQDFILHNAYSRNTYKKWNRRSKEIIFPSVIGESIDISVGIDTSGSMTEPELCSALTEVESILNMFDSWKLSLLSCDVNAHLIGEYSSDNGDNFTTISKSLIGGGGTDLNPIITKVEDENNETSVIVIITDGHIPKIQGSNLIPTIIVVTPNGGKFECSNIYDIVLME